MFGDNLRELRKAKGYTQEELAIKLNVVRQTISKWEKGLSVPDAEVLSRMADILETDVSKLLGEEITKEDNRNEIALQLGKISEQIAIKNRRSKKLWRGVGIALAGILTVIIITIIVSIIAYHRYAYTPSDVVTEEFVETEIEE